MKRVLVLGAGKMVEAILVGLAEKMSLSHWQIYSPSGVSAKALAQKVEGTHVQDLAQVSEVDWVLVGCKPQQLASLKETLAHRFKEATYLSLLAAITEDSQKQKLEVVKLVRVMPNLAVKFHEGVTLLSTHSAPEELSELEELFSKLGTVKSLSENELEELTLLTGSGPALFYEFTQNLVAGFSSLTEEEREGLARQVLLGAAISTKREAAPLKGMINAVTSKGGVTIAVLLEWRKQGLMDLLVKGVKAGKERTDELKKLILQS